MNKRSVVRLAEVATFSSGGTPSKADASFWKGDIPWVSPKDMKCDHLLDTEDKVTRAAVARSAARTVGPDSVLAVVRSGILTHSFPVATLAREMSFNQDIKALTPKSSLLLPRFLFWVLKNKEAYILQSGVKKGATVHSVASGFLERLQFPLPSVSDQRRLIGLLNRAALIKRRANAVRAEARSIIPTLFLSTFGDPGNNPKGWPSISFEQAVEDVTRFVPKTMKRNYLQNGAFPVYDQGQTAIAGYTNESSQTYLAEAPLILFGDHTRVFRLAHGRFARGADGVRLFSPSGDFDASFLRQYFELHGLPDAGYSRHYRFLKSISVWMPPLSLQRAFAERTGRLEGIATQLDAAAGKAEEMAAALLAEVFG